MLATLAQTGGDVALEVATPSVDWKALAPTLILIGGAFTLLTITADIVNPISIFSR